MMESISPIIEKFKLNVLKIEGVPESFSSEVYKLTLVNGQQVYLKVPFNRSKLVREYKMLELLKDVIPVPKVLDLWDGDERSVGALLLSAIPGVPCTEAVDHKLAFQIGVYHALLHNVAMPAYGVHENDGYRTLEHNDWRLYIKNNFMKWQDTCRSILSHGLFERCLCHFDRGFAALPEPDGPCVVHMDFRPGNILINDNKVTGIIDYESARGGSTEIDFTKIKRYIWEVYPDTKQPYLQGYESVRPLADLDSLLPFYHFYDAFSAVAWCEKRGVEKNKTFLQESIAELQKSVELNPY
jgi:Ser/Thr protein kinase RdoA (MazF antagonist)